MTDYLNSTEGITLINTILSYRAWVEPLHRKKDAMNLLSGKIDQKSLDSKKMIQLHSQNRLNNAKFEKIKLNFQISMNKFIVELHKSINKIKEKFIAVLDYNFLLGCEEVTPILDKLILTIYREKREGVLI